MRKLLIGLMSAVAVCVLTVPAAAQDDCEVLSRAAKMLHQQQKWDIARMECEEYLQQCGYNPEIQHILDDCKNHLEDEITLLLDEIEQEPAPAPTLVPAQKATNTPAPVAAQKTANTPAPAPAPQPVPVEEPKKQVVFRVSQSYVEFPETGGEIQIAVTSDEGWKVTETPSWVSVRPSSSALTIQVARNERFSAREGDIVLTNDHYVELRVVVAQDRNSGYLKLSAQMIDDEYGDGGLYTIQVSSNQDWSAISPAEWCLTEAKGDKLEVWLDGNITGEARETVVEVTAPQSALGKQVIIVKQAPLNHYITINPNLIISSGKSSVAEITVRTDMPEYSVEGLPYWCKVSEQTAQSFVLEIADNKGGAAREAQCRVVVEGGNGQTLTIQQEDRLNYVTVSPKIVNASQRGGIITIHVDCSGSWRVVNLPDWCVVTEQTADTFTLSIGENDTNAPRTASFSVSSAGMREKIEVRQK